MKRYAYFFLFFLGLGFAGGVLPLANAEDIPGYQTGSITNSCNGEIIVTFINRDGEESSTTMQTSQTFSIPADTVEVKAELKGDAYEDETMSVGIVMPNGSAHTLQSLPGSVRIPTPQAAPIQPPQEPGLY